MTAAERRREYIRIADRRAKPGSGSSPEPIREHGVPYGPMDVSKYLGSVPFVVVGGLATRLYMPERMTLDIDILTSHSDVGRAEEALESSGCRKTGTLTIGGSTWELPDKRILDLIAPDEPWVPEVMESAVTGPHGMTYASLPGLVLMKLSSSRAQDVADISRMLGCADDDAINAVRDIVRRYHEQDLDDLESLINLGKLEHSE